MFLIIKSYVPDNKSLWKKYLKVTIPVIISSMILSLNIIVDNIMAGHIGNKSSNQANLSGIFIFGNISLVFMTLLFSFYELVGIFTAQYFGANDQDNFEKTIKLKFIIHIIYAFFVFFFIYFLFEYMARWFYNGDIKPAIMYARIVIIAYFIDALSKPFYSTLNQVGLTKYSLYISIASVTVNIITNFLLVRYIKRSVESLAYATLLAKFVEVIVIQVIVARKHRDYYFNIFSLISMGNMFWKMVIKKIMYVFTRVSWALMITGRQIVFNWGFNQKGNRSAEILAATGGIQSLMLVLGSGMFGIINVYIGQNLGNNKIEEAKYHSKKIIGYTLIMTMISSAVLLGFSLFYPLTNIVDVELSTKIKAEKILWIIALVSPWWALMDVFTGIIKSGGRVSWLSTLVFIATFLQLCWGIMFAFLHIQFGIIEQFILFYLLFFSFDFIKLIMIFILFKKIDWAVSVAENKEIKHKSKGEDGIKILQPIK